MGVIVVAVLFSAIGVSVGYLFARSRYTTDAAVEKARAEQLARQLVEVGRTHKQHVDQEAELRERAASTQAHLEETQRRLAEQQANEDRLMNEFEKLSRSTLQAANEQLLKVAVVC